MELVGRETYGLTIEIKAGSGITSLSQRRCVSCISITPIKNMFWSFLYLCHPIPSHVIQFWGIVWTCFCPSFHKCLWWMGEHGQLQKKHGMHFAPADGHHRLLTCKCSKQFTFDPRSRFINERSSIHKDNKSSTQVYAVLLVNYSAPNKVSLISDYISPR